MVLTTHPQQVLRLKKVLTYTTTSPLCLYGRLWGENYLYFTFIYALYEVWDRTQEHVIYLHTKPATC
jgi:hypothetical protein